MLGRGDSGDLGDDLSDLFVALGEAAAEHETGIVFLLDEVQFLDRGELEALIAALHQVSQRELPLTLAGAGLPQLRALTGAATSYAERLFRFPTIDRLPEQAADDALELPARAEGVEYERAANSRILELTDGYPYFLQEYGRHVWNAAAGPTTTAGRCRASARPRSARPRRELLPRPDRPRHRPSSRISPRWLTSAQGPTARARSRRGSDALGPRARSHARAAD